MNRSTRGAIRVTLLPGMAVAGVLLTGCGAGQIAETAEKEPSIQGVNLTTDNGEYAIRDLLITFPGASGYQAGANAPLSAVIYNDSTRPATVTVTTQDARDVVIVGAAQAVPPRPGTPRAGAPATSASSQSPGRSPSAEGSPQGRPPQPATEPARVELPPLSFVRFNAQAGRYFQLLGLDESLRSGQTASITFDFGNGHLVTGPAPVAAPLTPVGPPPPIVEREGGDRGD
ncbi:hypothetical protein AB0J27_11310 [Micromonospora chokoriensis]